MNDAIVAILPFIVSVVAILVSIVIHEFSHGVAAHLQGDPTPKDQGRLTLNPIPHIDPLGTLLIPGFLLLTGSPFLIGWARPMPFNPYNLRNARYGSLLVALAGPLSNFLIFIIAGLLLKYYFPALEAANFLVIFLAKLVLVNFVLGFFNMIPIPPLDGSKVLFGLLPQQFDDWRDWMEKNSMVVFVAFLILEMIFGVFSNLLRLCLGLAINALGIPL